MALTRIFTWTMLLAIDLALPTPGVAQSPPSTRYVVDTVVIAVRAEPGSAGKVVGRLASGDSVELTGEREGVYAGIRTRNGSSGWVDGRYLTAQPVASMRLDELERELQSSQSARRSAEESLVRLSDDYGRLKAEIEEMRSTGVQPQALEAEIAALKERLALAEATQVELKRKNKELAENVEWHWFLSGAGVLVAGIILGIAVPRRRRSSWGSL